MDFISETFRDLLVSLLATAIIALMQWIIRRIYKNKYNFLLGEWKGYYLSMKGDLLLEQKIEISFNLFNQLCIKIEENTAANYRFKGKLTMIEDRLFGHIKGLEHEEKSYLVMIIPFNRKGVVPSMNGLFAGITQEKFPAAIKIHWSRSPKSIKQVAEELEPDAKFLIVMNDTKENLLRKDVDESKKVKSV